MNFFVDAFAWILDPAHWAGTNGIAQRLARAPRLHRRSAVADRARRSRCRSGCSSGTPAGPRVAIALTSAARALPTLGCSSCSSSLLRRARAQRPACIVVLVVLASRRCSRAPTPGSSRSTGRPIDAARAIGHDRVADLRSVEVPLALPLIIGGLRSAVLQIIATATIAAYVGADGLGRYIIEGLARRDYAHVIAGAILVTALALLVDGLSPLIQRHVPPRGVSRGAGPHHQTPHLGGRPVASSPEGLTRKDKHADVSSGSDAIAARALALAVGTAALAGCGGSRKRLDGESTASGDSKSLTIGSQGFPESEILAQIYGQVLEANGYDVDYKGRHRLTRDVHARTPKRRDRPDPRVRGQPALRR